MNSDKLQKLEKYFFTAVTILSLFPVFLVKFFPTLDGASHLHNAYLIRSLILDNNSILESFYMFNDVLVPNWTSHLLLAFFSIFLPAFIAEKLLLVIYLAGLPVAFRNLIKTLSPDNRLLSYLIFPFVYSFVFHLGFYNFCIALVLLLISINYWLKNEEEAPSVKSFIIFSLLALVTYFSHFFVFAVLLIILFLNILVTSIIKVLNNPADLKPETARSIRKLLRLAATAILPLGLLLLYFFSTHTASTNHTYVETRELVQWIKNIRPIISLSFEWEEPFTKKLFYLIVLLSFLSVYNQINSIKFPDLQSAFDKLRYVLRSIITTSNLFLMVSAVFLALYFILPDSDGQAGYVSIRLGLLFFIMLIIWLAVQSFPKWLSVTSAIVVLFLHFNLNYLYLSEALKLNEIAVESNNAAQHIEPYSVVLPLNYSDNWLLGHFSNYLGTDKPLIILENYECASGLFPLKWNDSPMPNTTLAGESLHNFPCVQGRGNMNNPDKTIDYIFVLGDMGHKTDSCTMRIRETMSAQYNLVYETNHTRLYQIKQNN